MSSELEALIRIERDRFHTPNLYRYLGNENVEVHLENFRENKQDTELILFFEHQGILLFPVWFEFRSINNNLLYLIEEFKVPDFKTLRRILVSSLEKEEHYMATFKALVYKTKKKPPYVHPLPDFTIDQGDKIEVNET